MNIMAVIIFLITKAFWTECVVTKDLIVIGLRVCTSSLLYSPVTMKNNKNNKITTYLGLFFVILVGSGLASISYMGKKIEQSITAALLMESSTHSSNPSFYLELVGYKRSFFDASFETRLRTTNSELDATINHIVFHTDVKHGPVIWSNQNLQFALANFSSSLDKSQLDGNMIELVERLFGDKEPFTASLLVDYKQNKHYQLNSSSFEYKVADIAVKISKGSLNTVVKSSIEVPAIEFKIDNITFNDNGKLLTSVENKMVFNVWDDNKNQLTSSLVMTDDVKYKDMSVNLDNLQITTLFEWLGYYEDRFSVDQQIEWTLEEAAQYQEGQDRLITLFSEQEQKLLPETDQLVSQLFKQGEKDISYLSKIEKTEVVYNTLTSSQ